MIFTKREVSARGEGGDLFLKVADGESVIGVFRGEIFEFYQSWPQGGKKTVYSEPTAGASARFKANFVTKDESGKFVAKVWEFGLTVYNQLAEIADEYDITTTKIKLSRRGAGKETVWMILPLLKEPLGPVTLTELAAVPLNLLGAPPKGSSPPKDNAPWPDNEDIPF